MDYEERKALAMEEAKIRRDANLALQELEQQGVDSLEQSMIDLAKVINEKLIDAINKAEARANELVREEGAERAEAASPFSTKPVNAQGQIVNPFTDPLAKIPGVDPLGQDATQIPVTPAGAPTPPVDTTAAAGAAAGGTVAASVPIDTSALPDGISLDTNVNLVASIPNMEGLQAQIVSTTVGQVSQLINEATNGQINLKPASRSEG